MAVFLVEVAELSIQLFPLFLFVSEALRLGRCLACTTFKTNVGEPLFSSQSVVP